MSETDLYFPHCAQCKINRMPGSHFLCRKDQLTINYKWLQSKAGKDEKEITNDSFFIQVKRNSTFSLKATHFLRTGKN